MNDNRRRWFDVDPDGLAASRQADGKSWVLYELAQNAFDEPGVTQLDITLQKGQGQHSSLIVRDDAPNGFVDLMHAYTLHAHSPKKGDATKRGRWDVGEKHVLALCKSAVIRSTTGTIVFDGRGRRQTDERSDTGTIFVAQIDMCEGEREKVLRDFRRVFIPPHINVTLNGDELPFRNPHKTVEVTLETEVAGEDKILRRTRRKTQVQLHRVEPGEEAWMFEMGIPVCPVGSENETFHYDVQQRVPLGMDRQSVRPAYLAKLRAAVLNETYTDLSADEATTSWVSNAMEDPDITPEAVTEIATKRFGEKRVAFDPSDPEANNIAMSRGYTVVHGRTFSKEAWRNIRGAGAILPAGKVTPSPKPYHPDGEPLQLIPTDEWTTDMQKFVSYAKVIGEEITGGTVSVCLTREPGWGFSGTYGRRRLTVNLAAVHIRDADQVNRFLAHEFAHHFESNHLAEEFHKACCRNAATMVRLALTHEEVQIFNEEMR